MFQAVPAPRTLRRATGALGAVALIALGAAPAAAADAPSPGLVLGKIAPVDGLKPGDSFDVPASFTNTGTEALPKVYLSYDISQGLGIDDVPSNCVSYEVLSMDEAPRGTDVICEFDQAVKPGVVYAPEKTQVIDALDNALYDQLRVSVSTYNPGGEDNHGESTPGTAPAVKLVERPEATPAPAGSAEHDGWDAATVSVTSVNTADFKAAASKVMGKVGDTVPLAVNFINAGPAWVQGASDVPVTKIRVAMPAGTTVVNDGGCRKLETRVYQCGTAQDWIEAGRTETHTFKLRIDKAVEGAKGSVKLGSEARPFDENKANDSADILTDVAGSGGGSTGGGGSTDGGGSATGGGSTSGGGSTTGGGGSTSSSTGGSGSATTGSTGSSAVDGDLASTGSSSALPLAGAAAAAIAVGAGAVLVVRRRKAQQ
ncbi:LAETG motif-containing sortase-dependent surface protein [Streptomyces sp. RG80]|uniref:LAETG motif-containing sortase-dependent surface protein n=1 Tax=Streptomyces sp. RG80 TaxID=3157340 RepID=UPI00338DEB08